MIIAIDFDGTIIDYDGCGTEKGVFNDVLPGAVDVISKLYEEGHTIIVHTCRAEIEAIRVFLEKNKIPFHDINHNPQNEEFGLSPAKMRADVYIDDRGITFDGQWWKVYWALQDYKEWWRK